MAVASQSTVVSTTWYAKLVDDASGSCYIYQLPKKSSANIFDRPQTIVAFLRVALDHRGGPFRSFHSQITSVTPPKTMTSSTAHFHQLLQEQAIYHFVMLNKCRYTPHIHGRLLGKQPPKRLAIHSTNVPQDFALRFRARIAFAFHLRKCCDA
jgi:hypothetical protein